MALEPRVMFDGAVVATLAEAHPMPGAEPAHMVPTHLLAAPHAPAAVMPADLVAGSARSVDGHGPGRS